ncbi:HET-domain-containing protein [Xylaria palmicola]|nr:HET-domain-containing protein [Xylaria palmicola]
MKWDPKAHEDILVAINAVIQPAQADWERVMANLHDKGYTFTESALKQHLQKLKNGSTPANTPKKPASAAASKGTPTKGKRASATPTKRRKAHNVDEDDDEDDKDQKDLKKIKLDKLENDDNIYGDGLWERAPATPIGDTHLEVGGHGWYGHLNRSGYWKILKTCLEARKDGLDYLWVDTNCIDKTSSSDLSEAINSMYAWYRNASICYAYLSDVVISESTYASPRLQTGQNTVDLQGSSLDSFVQSRWFCRGWTLQELLAPRTKEMAPLLAEITHVDEKYLLRAEDIRSASIAQRMAADIAYCLLGLFNVNMPLLYGEGPMAVSDDHSIFAWTWIAELTPRSNITTMAARHGRFSLDHKPSFPSNRIAALLRNRIKRDVVRPTTLAPDPACFFDASHVPVLKPRGSLGIFTMSNVGLSISLPIVVHPAKRLSLALIHDEYCPENDTRKVIMIPMAMHYRHTDRWTRTCFPVAPVTVVFPHRGGIVAAMETIQICRDIQHVPFYFDTFGGSSHRFGFWILFPQVQYHLLRLEAGCVLGNGVFNHHGIFLDPDKNRTSQLLGGLLVFSIRTEPRAEQRGWHDRAVYLFLVQALQRTPEGEFRKTSRHCKVLVQPRAAVDAQRVLERYTAGLRKDLESGKHMRDSFEHSVSNFEERSSVGYKGRRLRVSAACLNDEPLSHSPQSEITLVWLNMWDPEQESES